jgi:hypothetical protein
MIMSRHFCPPKSSKSIIFHQNILPIFPMYYNTTPKTWKITISKGKLSTRQDKISTLKTAISPSEKAVVSSGVWSLCPTSGGQYHNKSNLVKILRLTEMPDNTPCYYGRSSCWLAIVKILRLRWTPENTINIRVKWQRYRNIEGLR